MAVASSSTSPSTNDTDPTDSSDAFLDSVEGEIAFFRSLMRARPVGVHRHFHAIAIRNAIFRDTGRSVTIEALWNKLRTCYNLQALEVADAEHENLYAPHKNSPSAPIPSPSPTDNLSAHPFFRSEFQLPYDDDIDMIIAERRMRATTSAPSTPTPAPSSPESVAAATPAPPQPAPPQPTSSSSSTKRQKAGKKRGKSQSKLAGLVGGDSDSSALTQESGDEGAPETPRDSVITGTDGGTEYGEDEDVEMQEAAAASSRRSASPKAPRGRTKGARGKKGARGASARGAAKKRKR